MADQITLPRAVVEQALEALAGYRRELNEQQPCDAEIALRAALAQAEPEDVLFTECVFVGPAPAPHENWYAALSAMMQDKRIKGLRISAATVDDWNGGKEQQAEPVQSRAEAMQALRSVECAHTGMSYGDDKRGDRSDYTRGWGDCLKAVKDAIATLGNSNG